MPLSPNRLIPHATLNDNVSVSSPASPAATPEAVAATALDSSVAPDSQRSSETLAKHAALVSVATMTSRILGLVRDQVLTIKFGTGDQLDAFNVAFRLPGLVRDLFAEGAMSAAFVPTFTRELKRDGRNAAWELGNLVITGLLVATSLISVLAIIFAGPLTHWIAGDYAKVPGKLELTTQLTQVMFPFLTLIAVAVAFMGMLNSLRWFFIPALAPAAFNVASILSVFVIVPFMKPLGLDPMMGLAIGTLLGGLGQLLIQWPALRREGFRFQFRFAPRDPRFREVIGLMAPGTLGLAAVQVNQLVNMWLATHEGTGAVSYLNIAFRLMFLPIGLFGVSIATAALPMIARHAANDDEKGIRESVSSALRLMLMLNVPATFGLIALAQPIIQMLVGYGKVSPNDVHGMALALICYAPGLVGYSAVKIASPTFYAMRDSRTPVMVSVLSVTTNIVLNLTLVQFLSYRGLALGTSLAALVNAGALFWILRGRLHGLDGRRIALALTKILAASVIMAIVSWGIEHELSIWWAGHNALHRIVRVGLAVSGGLGTLVIMAKLLRLEEFERAFGRVLGRFVGKPTRG
jgi:putative peptidoglycan lipid II flippase